MGLFLNEMKTEYINQTSDILSHIKTLAGTVLKEKDDYIYLGSHISSSEKILWSERVWHGQPVTIYIKFGFRSSILK